MSEGCHHERMSVKCPVRCECPNTLAITINVLQFYLNIIPSFSHKVMKLDSESWCKLRDYPVQLSQIAAKKKHEAQRTGLISGRAWVEHRFSSPRQGLSTCPHCL